MKKAVAFGSAAYLSYKASKKLRKKFKPKKYRSRKGNKVDEVDVDFDDWEDWREEDVNLSPPGAVEPDDFIMGVIELVTTFVFFFALPGREAVC